MIYKKKDNLLTVLLLLLNFIILIPFFSTCCVLNKKSQAIKNDLKNAVVIDLKSATNDIKKLAIKDLTEESLNKSIMLDNQYKIAFDELKSNRLDSPQNIMSATEKYIKERERIREELVERAQFYTKLLVKIDNGWMAIQALENMDQATEDARRSLLIDVVSKDLPIVATSMYGSGKIDNEFLNIISKNLGSDVIKIKGEDNFK